MFFGIVLLIVGIVMVVLARSLQTPYPVGTLLLVFGIILAIVGVLLILFGVMDYAPWHSDPHYASMLLSDLVA